MNILETVWIPGEVIIIMISDGQNNGEMIVM